jgi:hypothetical protein
VTPIHSVLTFTDEERGCLLCSFNESPVVLRRVTRTWRLSLPADQIGRKRLRPGTVYFSTNLGLGDTPYRPTTRVADGARQALLPVTGLFGTPNAQRGYPPPKDFCRKDSYPIVSTLRRDQQGHNLRALPALGDRRRQEALDLLRSCPAFFQLLGKALTSASKAARHSARAPLSQGRRCRRQEGQAEPSTPPPREKGAAAGQEGPAAPCALLLCRKGAAADL